MEEEVTGLVKLHEGVAAALQAIDEGARRNEEAYQLQADRAERADKSQRALIDYMRQSEERAARSQERLMARMLEAADKSEHAQVTLM